MNKSQSTCTQHHTYIVYDFIRYSYYTHIILDTININFYEMKVSLDKRYGFINDGFGFSTFEKELVMMIHYIILYVLHSINCLRSFRYVLK